MTTLEVNFLDLMIVLFVLISFFSILSFILAIKMVRKNTHIRKYISKNQEKAFLKSKYFEHDEKNRRRYYLVFTLRNGENFRAEVKKNVYDQATIETEAFLAIEKNQLLFFDQIPIKTEWTE